jgi:hypothetical protein
LFIFDVIHVLVNKQGEKMLYLDATKEIEELEAWVINDPINADDYRDQIEQVKKESKWFFTIDGSIESGWDTYEAAEEAMNDWMLDHKHADATADVERLY